MKLFSLIAIAALSLGERVSAFSVPSASCSSRIAKSKTQLQAAIQDEQHIIQRRTLLSNFLTTTASTLSFMAITSSSPSTASAAVPGVTMAEFEIILKDSAKSILSVELSGPKSETGIVKLVDGTTFTISDLVESSTDPRSPLKLVARCRLYNIPVKNTGLVSAVNGEGSLVSSSGKKKKNYMNPRVQEAEKKQQARRERMAEDERERLEEVYKMEGQEKGFLSE